DRGQILDGLGDGREQIIDARRRSRFEGSEPEPREGMRSGHIPGSLNLPFTEIVDQASQTLLAPDALRQRFEAEGLDLSRPVITSCGSGVTAGVLALGLHRLGHQDTAVYDGSWSDWGRPGDTPVETGPAGSAAASE
ncbi:MAG TPA: sulfurtransferase, partial [Kiloniellaceae bacterium]|nr:sulfurtransferase [Kiloniellaceae bacterium]